MAGARTQRKHATATRSTHRNNGGPKGGTPHSRTVPFASLPELLRAYRVSVPALLAKLPEGEAKCTKHQLAVWAAVSCVPRGRVSTYMSLGFAA